MRIWLIKDAERLPTDGAGERLYRMGLLANCLLERGWEVVWWASAFDHVAKAYRVPDDRQVAVADRLRVWYLHGPGYTRNISLRRLWDHYVIGRKFTHYAATMPKPDIILCALPTLDLAVAATTYGRRFRVPVVVDLRDRWPDIFLEAAPHWARPIARLGLWPMFQALRQACSQAHALVGITPAFVNWGLTQAARARTPLDRDFPLAYPASAPTAEAMDAADQFWATVGLPPTVADSLVCFVGSGTQVLRLEVVLEAARQLHAAGHPIRFVLCGNLQKAQSRLEALPNVIWPGWLNQAQIWSLLQRSLAGLLPYTSRQDFEESLPNKVIEYMAAGLPTLSSVHGALGHFLEEERVGFVYDETRPEQLSAHILKLHQVTSLRQQMRANALQLFQTRFQAETVYNEFVDHLDRVAKHYYGQNT